MAGLLYSGDVFLWHKDTDLLRFVAGLSALAPHLEAGNGKGAFPSFLA